MDKALTTLMLEYEAQQNFTGAAGVESDEESGIKYIAKVLSSKSAIVVQKDHGYCVGFVCPYVCNPNVLHAQEMGCYSREGKEAELREEFDKIAKERGCKFAVLSCYLEKEGPRFRKYA